MTFKALFLCAVIAGASALAISCAAPAQTSQTEDTKPIETVTLPAAENFTTVGKPTKTIETPWGPREIYDPAQDAEVQEIISNINIKDNSKLFDHPIIASAINKSLDQLEQNGCKVYYNSKCEVCTFHKVQSRSDRMQFSQQPICFERDLDGLDVKYLDSSKLGQHKICQVNGQSISSTGTYSYVGSKNKYEPNKLFEYECENWNFPKEK